MREFIVQVKSGGTRQPNNVRANKHCARSHLEARMIPILHFIAGINAGIQLRPDSPSDKEQKITSSM